MKEGNERGSSKKKESMEGVKKKKAKKKGGEKGAKKKGGEKQSTREAVQGHKNKLYHFTIGGVSCVRLLDVIPLFNGGTSKQTASGGRPHGVQSDGEGGKETAHPCFCG